METFKSSSEPLHKFTRDLTKSSWDKDQELSYGHSPNGSGPEITSSAEYLLEYKHWQWLLGATENKFNSNITWLEEILENRKTGSRKTNKEAITITSTSNLQNSAQTFIQCLSRSPPDAVACPTKIFYLLCIHLAFFPLDLECKFYDVRNSLSFAPQPPDCTTMP